MNKNGPIIVIEDSEGDRLMLSEVFDKLNYVNKVLFFEDGALALNFLNTTGELPFLILSDINMPKLDGIELRKKLKIDAALHLKCIPYLFFSTAFNEKTVIEAYSLSIQGFFAKPSAPEDLENIIMRIIEYWKLCTAPNDFDIASLPG